MEEIWKPVGGYEEFYCVSNSGKIKSLRRNKILIGNLTTKGYPFVILSVKGTPKTLTVHRVVASHFLENTEQKQCVNHKDCDRTNNKVENLEWVTYGENNLHSIRMGRKKYKGEFNPKAKLTIENVKYIRMSKETSTNLAKFFNVSISNICDIKKNKIWVGC